jgi:hypothetical protein
MKDKLTPNLAQFANKSLPRGLRNNNPGNLRKSAAKWAGKVSNPLDTAFESFDSMANGVRAAIRNAHTQWNRGKNTIAQLITIWAPPSENDTTKYVATVAKAAGISSTQQFTFGNNDTTAKIMYAIFIHENGPLAKSHLTVDQIKAQLAALWPATVVAASAPKNAPKV